MNFGRSYAAGTLPTLVYQAERLSAAKRLKRVVAQTRTRKMIKMIQREPERWKHGLEQERDSFFQTIKKHLQLETEMLLRLFVATRIFS